MTKQEVKKAWKNLGFAVLGNKPNIKGPYPSKMVRMRELLLFAEVTLCKVDVGEHIAFNEELYQKTMNFYELQRSNQKLR